MTINKKIRTIFFLFFVLIILFLAGYLTYDYLEYKKEIEDYSYEIPKIVEYENLDNYEIIETEEGKKIVNENSGLSFVVPSDWNVEKIDRDGILEIVTPDIIREPNTYGGFIKNGCVFWFMINIYLDNEIGEKRPDLILQRIERLNNLNNDFQEVIYVDNYASLKTLQQSNNFQLFTIEIPINNFVYKLNSYNSLKDQDICSNKFNQILETISIKI